MQVRKTPSRWTLPVLKRHSGFLNGHVEKMSILCPGNQSSGDKWNSSSQQEEGLGWLRQMDFQLTAGGRSCLVTTNGIPAHSRRKVLAGYDKWISSSQQEEGLGWLQMPRQFKAGFNNNGDSRL